MMASSIDSASAESDIHELLVNSDDDNFEEVGSHHNERAREGEGAGEDSTEKRRVNISRMVENPESSSEEDDEETAEVEVSRTRKKPSPVWKYGKKVKGGSICNICGVFKPQCLLWRAHNICINRNFHAAFCRPIK